ncbi:MAG: hypothetical protein RLY64_503, partial [Bacteroidota bacterium]
SGVGYENYLTFGTTNAAPIARSINDFQILDGRMGFAGSSHSDCFWMKGKNRDENS